MEHHRKMLQYLNMKNVMDEVFGLQRLWNHQDSVMLDILAGTPAKSRFAGGSQLSDCPLGLPARQELTSSC